MRECLSYSVEETMAAGAVMAQTAYPDECIVLTGDLGAGKTHFTKGFAAALGIEEEVTSPTFAIVEEYEGGRLPLLHWDLYRLEEDWELEDVDWYGLTESGAVSLVEWGEKFPDALPEGYLHVDIRVLDDGARSITVTEGDL